MCAVIEMAEATTESERHAVFRFWYSVYVEEMGRYLDVADHDGRELRDPEDEHSRLLFARDDGQVVAAYRLSWGGDGFSERQIREYSLEPFLAELPKEWLIIGERNMVAATHRGGSVFAELAMLAGPIAESLGALLSFGACEPHLVSYYACFNNQPYAMRQFFSDGAGYVIPIVSLTHPERFGAQPLAAAQDRQQRLLDTGSRTSSESATSVPSCIQRILRGDSAVRNAGVIGVDAYAVELRDALAPLLDRPSLFSGLSDADIERCCVHSSLITCAAGDQILRAGGTARNPFLVVAGRLQARRNGDARLDLGPGDLFGESGWLGKDNRHSDVFVLEPASRVLALSLGTIRAICDTDPTLALKITANASATLWSRLRDVGYLTG